jgi:murein L,D-transpeptidase YafK
MHLPDGFYYINILNPASNIFLSLGINFPTEADLKRTEAIDPSGDIFIHGNPETVARHCMTGDVMKETYSLSVVSKSNGQERISVYIYPYRFNVLNNLLFATFIKYAGCGRIITIFK